MENLEQIRAVKKQHEQNWMAINGVIAVGIGLTSTQQTGIIITVTALTDTIKNAIPAVINNVPIEIRESDELKAF